MANDSLAKAKKIKNDEFYTLYEYIQKEVNAYLEYNPDTFRDKTVLCPCDDPEWSNFTKFFAQNFELLGLKKLISTSYSLKSKQAKYERYHQMTIFEINDPQYDEVKSFENGRIFTLTRDTNSEKIDYDDLKWNYLEGDGDFRSDEVKRLRDEADIIVTNPPFSLFREFISWILNADKKCILIGQVGMVCYKEIFPEFKNNRMWFGVTCNNEDMVFEVPEGAEVNPKDKEKAERMGYVGNYTRQGSACWFTNIDHGRRHQPIPLMTMADNLKYSKHKAIIENGYLRYDNYDAIEVPYVDAIPSDYNGAMGVPITFMDKYCPEQFEIIDITKAGAGNKKTKTKEYPKQIQVDKNGKRTEVTKLNDGAVIEINEEPIDKTYYIVDGAMYIQTYPRILIRRIKGDNDL